MPMALSGNVEKATENPMVSYGSKSHGFPTLDSIEMDSIEMDLLTIPHRNSPLGVPELPVEWHGNEPVVTVPAGGTSGVWWKRNNGMTPRKCISVIYNILNVLNVLNVLNILSNSCQTQLSTNPPVQGFQQSSQLFIPPWQMAPKFMRILHPQLVLSCSAQTFSLRPAPADPAKPRWITIPTAQHRVWLTLLTATMRMAMAGPWTTCRTWAMGDTPKGITDTRTMDSMDMDRPLDSRGRRLMNRSWLMWKTCNLEMNTVMWCVTWLQARCHGV